MSSHHAPQASNSLPSPVLEVHVKGRLLRLPALWLRDVSEWHCHTFQRTVNMAAVPPDLTVSNSHSDEEEGVLTVTWSTADGTGLPPAHASDTRSCVVVTSLSQIASMPAHVRASLGAATSWDPPGLHLQTRFDLKWLLAHAPGEFSTDAAYRQAYLPLAKEVWRGDSWVGRSDADVERLMQLHIPHTQHARMVPVPARAGTVGTAVLPSVPYDDVIGSETGLRDWLALVQQYGFGMVNGAPATDEGTERLARRITWPRPTMYSSGMWRTEVRPPESIQDTAYSADALPSHTDGNYFEATPGIQIFHAIVAAASGGHSVLVDGFAVAQALRVKHRVSHDWLLAHDVPYRYLDKDRSYLAHHRTLKVCADGETYSDFHYNALDRAPFTAPPGVDAASWLNQAYAAVRHLEHAMQDPDLELRFLLQPGTVLAFDNRRLLHGRDAFEVTSGRTLVGCYLDREEWISRYIVAAAAAAAVCE